MQRSLEKASALLLIASLSPSLPTYAAQGAEEPVIEEILVTATRRAESVQDVPISVSVVSSDDIAATGTIDLKDLAAQVPNFVFAESPNQGLSFLSIRGIYSRA
ncbi:MAG: TonB-dependent receptor plug domain-containing protein, partial [Pseudomonadales bacterium]